MPNLNLEQLAARVEAATGPDYALEFDIARTLKRAAHPPKNYTASLDAAMSLVPEGATWELDCGTEQSTATVFAPIADEPGWVTDAPAQAATPALALVAAALRATNGGEK